jgi:hypothetical protein
VLGLTGEFDFALFPAKVIVVLAFVTAKEAVIHVVSFAPETSITQPSFVVKRGLKKVPRFSALQIGDVANRPGPGEIQKLVQVVSGPALQTQVVNQ